MKKLLLITFMVASLYAEAKKIKGIIIVNNESHEVTFDIKVPLFHGEPNFERLQYKVRYYDENGKRQTLRPDKADEIRFNYDGKEVRMISCSTRLGDTEINSARKRIFLKLEIEGQLRLYRYYYVDYKSTYNNTSPTGAGSAVPATSIDDIFIFQKGGGPLKQPETMRFKKDMLEYFKDCPQLQDLIESKDFRRKEIEAIVLFYNHNCGEK
jgi:hypothetical protein